MPAPGSYPQQASETRADTSPFPDALVVGGIAFDAAYPLVLTGQGPCRRRRRTPSRRSASPGRSCRAARSRWPPQSPSSSRTQASSCSASGAATGRRRLRGWPSSRWSGWDGTRPMRASRAATRSRRPGHGPPRRRGAVPAAADHGARRARAVRGHLAAHRCEVGLRDPDRRGQDMGRPQVPR